MNGICPHHGLQHFTETLNDRRGSTARCLKCVALSVERNPRQFSLTQAFFFRLRPYFSKGLPVGVLLR